MANAGVITAGSWETTTAEQWRLVLDVNLLGRVEHLRYVLPHLVDHGGSLVNICSVAGIKRPAGGQISAVTDPSATWSRRRVVSVLTLGLIVLFVYTGLEVSAGQWETSYLRGHLGLSASGARRRPRRGVPGPHRQHAAADRRRASTARYRPASGRRRSRRNRHLRTHRPPDRHHQPCCPRLRHHPRAAARPGELNLGTARPHPSPTPFGGA